MKGNDNLKKYLKRTEGISSRRVLMTALMALAVLVIGAVLVAGVCLKEQAGWAGICLCVPLQVCP